MIFVPRYWPFWTSSRTMIFDYEDRGAEAPAMRSVFRYDNNTGSMTLDDYDASSQWKDRWFYRYVPSGGVEEWRDDTADSFWGVRTVVFAEPIRWGNYVEIGKTITNYPRASIFKSWPPTWMSGTQHVNFEAVYDTWNAYRDVLQFFYLQSFNGGDYKGARYWFAADVGPVALQWLAVMKDGRRIERPMQMAKVTNG